MEDNPRDARARRDLAVALEAMGQLLLATDDPEGALSSVQEFSMVITTLSAEHPENSRLHGRVATSHEMIAQAMEALSLPHAALTGYREALRILSDLVAQDPGEVRLKEARARVLSSLGALLAETGNPENARRMLGQARSAYEELQGLIDMVILLIL